MTWTGAIIDIRKGDFTKPNEAGRLFVTYELTNGATARSFVEQVSDPASVQRIVLNAVAQFNRIADADTDSLLGPVSAPDQPVHPEPPQADKDAQAYQAARQALAQAKSDFDLGLADQPAVDAALQAAKAAQSKAAASAIADAEAAQALAPGP